MASRARTTRARAEGGGSHAIAHAPASACVSHSARAGPVTWGCCCERRAAVRRGSRGHSRSHRLQRVSKLQLTTAC